MLLTPLTEKLDIHFAAILSIVISPINFATIPYLPPDSVSDMNTDYVVQYYRTFGCFDFLIFFVELVLW